MQHGGQVPISKIIHNVAPATKQAIIKSGKGLEGYIKQFSSFFEVSVVNGEKRVLVVDRTVDFGLPPQPMSDSSPASATTTSTTATAAPAANASPRSNPNTPPVETTRPKTSPAAEGSVPKPSLAFATKPAMATTAKPEVPPTPKPEEASPLPKAPITTDRGWAKPAATSTEAAAAPEAKPVPPTAKAEVASESKPQDTTQHTTVESQAPSTAPSATTGPSPATANVSKAAPSTAKQQLSAATPDDVPSAANNWAGWGAQGQVPNTTDVFEILKFVPVHWTNFGNLTIPAETKRRHIRVASALAWFSRQPRYFDVRVVAGTIEVRRSVLMHPEAHNLTKEQAEKIVADRIAADKEAGEPVPLKMARAAPSTVKTAASSPAPTGGSAATDAVSKAMLRICPSYYITAESVCKRSTRRLDLADLVDGAQRNKAHIDMLHIQSTTAKYATTLFRRRSGADTARWEEDFTKEIATSSSLALLVSCMTLSCAQWDRLHFLYVRLPDEDKVAIGGFDGMVAFLKAHPHVFIVGEYFFKRIDPSDPHFDANEPQSNAITSTKVLEDNPYHQSRDLALVFHYLTPEDQPCSLAHYVDCASPCMKSVLPPRLITIIQAHPELLQYREVSPGTFAVSRTVPDDANAKPLSPEETLAEIVKLVPPRGIDASHLMSSLPPQLHSAVVRNFGRDGINELVTRNIHLFHVVRNPPYVTLFLKKPVKPAA